MYIPAWPTLSPSYFLKPGSGESLPFPLGRPGNTYFYVARNGIYHLMRSLGIGEAATVLVPDYHHGNEVYAIRAAGAGIRYYRVKKNLDVDLDALSELCKTRPRVLFVTHYVGWPQPMREIQSLCRHYGIILVEDCALGFLSDLDGQPLGSFGDYSVFSLYKTVPVPNGGVLVKNVAAPASLDELALRRCDAISVFGQSVELMLLWLRAQSETCGRVSIGLKRRAGHFLSSREIRRIPVGDTGFDASRTSLEMSSISHTLLRRFHYESVKENRRNNFQVLASRLRGRVQFVDKNLEKGVCPLFFPLLVTEKHTAAHLLWQERIQTVEFWNNPDPQLRNEKTDAEFLRRHLLEVPIHQDVTPEGVEFMAQQILDLRIGLPA
jgi:perosamine synthetase